MEPVKFRQVLLEEVITSDRQAAVQGKYPLAENTLEFTIYKGFKIQFLKF